MFECSEELQLLNYNYRITVKYMMISENNFSILKLKKVLHIASRVRF